MASKIPRRADEVDDAVGSGATADVEDEEGTGVHMCSGRRLILEQAANFDEGFSE